MHHEKAAGKLGVQESLLSLLFHIIGNVKKALVLFMRFLGIKLLASQFVFLRQT